MYWFLITYASTVLYPLSPILCLFSSHFVGLIYVLKTRVIIGQRWQENPIKCTILHPYWNLSSNCVGFMDKFTIPSQQWSGLLMYNYMVIKVKRVWCFKEILPKAFEPRGILMLQMELHLIKLQKYMHAKSNLSWNLQIESLEKCSNENSMTRSPLIW